MPQKHRRNAKRPNQKQGVCKP